MPVYHNLPSLVKPIWTQTPVTGCLTYPILGLVVTLISESSLNVGSEAEHVNSQAHLSNFGFGATLISDP